MYTLQKYNAKTKYVIFELINFSKALWSSYYLFQFSRRRRIIPKTGVTDLSIFIKYFFPVINFVFFHFRNDMVNEFEYSFS